MQNKLTAPIDNIDEVEKFLNEIPFEKGEYFIEITDAPISEEEKNENLWNLKELIKFLSNKDFKIKYKDTKWDDIEEISKAKEEYLKTESQIGIHLDLSQVQIENMAFLINAPNLVSIKYPNILKSIDLYLTGAFPSYNLKEIIFPDCLKEINSDFDECLKLKTINFPKNLKKLAKFNKCDSLEHIELPNGLEDLPNFIECKNLKSVKFPYMEDYCFETLFPTFEKCDNLQKIIIPGKPEFIEENTENSEDIFEDPELESVLKDELRKMFEEIKTKIDSGEIQMPDNNGILNIEDFKAGKYSEKEIQEKLAYLFENKKVPKGLQLVLEEEE